MLHMWVSFEGLIVGSFKGFHPPRSTFLIHLHQVPPLPYASHYSRNSLRGHGLGRMCRKCPGLRFGPLSSNTWDTVN